MKTVTLKIDPMPMLRVSAKLKVDLEFNRRAADMLHRDHGYRWKREVAAAVLRGEELNEDHAFRQEAQMRGLSVRQLAEVVASKPDTIAAREIERQGLINAIESAKSHDDLKQILSKIGH